MSLECEPRFAVWAAQIRREQQGGIRQDGITPALGGMVWKGQSSAFEPAQPQPPTGLSIFVPSSPSVPSQQPSPRELLTSPVLSLQVVGEWRFSRIHCDIFVTLDVMMCTASILNLCAISIDR